MIERRIPRYTDRFIVRATPAEFVASLAPGLGGQGYHLTSQNDQLATFYKPAKTALQRGMLAAGSKDRIVTLTFGQPNAYGDRYIQLESNDVALKKFFDREWANRRADLA